MLAVLVGLQAGGVASEEPNLIENGGFELGASPGRYVTLGERSSAVEGWTVTSQTVDYIGSYFQCAEGGRCLDMDGTPGFGGVSQTFASQPGRWYRVTFDLSGNNEGPPGIKRLRVSAANQSFETAFRSTSGPLIWEKRYWLFRASASQTTIDFRSINKEGGAYGALLDGVSVSEIAVADALGTRSSSLNPFGIVSRFQGGNEGWQVVQDGTKTDLTTHSSEAAYSSSDGDGKDGYITARDEVGHAAWYWRAPGRFLGDASFAYGRTLEFDLKQTLTDAPFDGPDVILIGQDGQRLIYRKPGDNPGKEWTNYRVPLRESGDWRVDPGGSPVTSEQFIGVLSTLEELLIRGEFRTGDDTSSLDNVVFGRPTDSQTVDPIDPQPVSVVIVLGRLSATVGEAIDLYPMVVNQNRIPVILDRDRQIQLVTEGGTISPSELTLRTGERTAAVLLVPERQGMMTVTGTSAHLEPGSASAAGCGRGATTGFGFGINQQEARVGTAIDSYFFLSHDDKVDGAAVPQKTLVEFDYQGVGQLTPPGPAIIAANECMAKKQVVSLDPGVATVVARVSPFQEKSRTFRFHPTVFDQTLAYGVVLIGALVGATIRAARNWSQFRAASKLRLAVALLTGIVAGESVYLAYHFGILTVLRGLPDGFAVGAFCGLIGGYTGTSALDFVSGQVLPGSKKA